jgi:hypothetical protein
MEPTCATGCADALAVMPAVKFDDSCPEVNQGEITAIYLALRGNPFANWEQAAEWTTRLAAVDNTKIVKLTVIGDKPKPAANQLEISNGRKVTLAKDHVVNFTIDETNAINHEAIRTLQCGGNFDAWYETSGGLLFGGNAGLPASAECDMTIPREKGGLIVYEGTLTWKAKYTEERTVSPIA